MSLEGKRIAVLVENLYQEMELWVPVYRLREEGAEVLLVGPQAGEVYRSKNGYPAKADLAAADANPDDFAAVVIPGGYAPDLMRRNEAMVSFVRRMDEQGKVVAAICHAGWMLVSSGLATGRRLTSFWSIKDDLAAAGAQWVDEPVVVDGNVITSRIPDDLPAFNRAVLDRLSTLAAAAD
ncbi:MAG TPA: type 1 glutamine amidotransferase domain-containing protein [Bacillota bacterium]